MTKLVNRIALFVFIAVAITAWITYHEEMDIVVPYLKQVFLAIAIFMFILLFLKANYRWQASYLAKKASNSFIISRQGMKKAIVYESINIGFYAYLSIMLLLYVNEGFIIGILIGLYFLEGFVNLVQNLFSAGYRTLIQENAITVVSNYITIIPMKEIVKIESSHRDIRFLDKNNKTFLLDIDSIKADQHEAFIGQVKAIARSKDIYYDVAFTRDDIHHG